MASDPHDLLQDHDDLEGFWAEPDPWGYDSTSDDELRVARLLSALPARPYERTLDIGCGNGFLTCRLPGREVVGLDVSANALGWARERADATGEPGRFSFREGSVLALDPAELGAFDLIVITGVLYPQYVGHAFSTVVEMVRGVAASGAICASVQIDEWFPSRFPFVTLTLSVDPYREYTHRLEVFEVAS